MWIVSTFYSSSAFWPTLFIFYSHFRHGSSGFFKRFLFFFFCVSADRIYPSRLKKKHETQRLILSWKQSFHLSSWVFYKDLGQRDRISCWWIPDLCPVRGLDTSVTMIPRLKRKDSCEVISSLKVNYNCNVKSKHTLPPVDINGLVVKSVFYPTSYLVHSLLRCKHVQLQVAVSIWCHLGKDLNP